MIYNFVYILFSVIFLFEFCVKIIGMGFVLTENSYLRDGWNVIDFAVIISLFLQLFSIFFPTSFNFNISFIRSVRIL